MVTPSASSDPAPPPASTSTTPRDASPSAAVRRRVARSRRGRTLAFGWWGVADPTGFDPAMAEAFLAGAARHTDTRSAGAALVRSDPRQDLGRVGCPCLCLWGASDNWVPLTDGMEYARRLRAPLRVIADCGHLLIGERPDAVLAAVRDFLVSLDGPGGQTPGVAKPLG